MTWASCSVVMLQHCLLNCYCCHRSGSLKRKHLDSLASLSEVEPTSIPQTTNGARLTTPQRESSSSSVSACSSDLALALCDDFPSEETARFGETEGSQSSRETGSKAFGVDNFGTSGSWSNRIAGSQSLEDSFVAPKSQRESETESQTFRDNLGTSESWSRMESGCLCFEKGNFGTLPSRRLDETGDSESLGMSGYNRNTLPGGWMLCQNIALHEEDVFNSLERRVSNILSQEDLVDDPFGSKSDFLETQSEPLGVSYNPPWARRDPLGTRTPPRFCANVLVVSHGGFISQLLGHFVDDFDCLLPGNSSSKVVSTVTPNAALSRFSVTISRPSDDDDNSNDVGSECGRPSNQVWIRCVALHDKEHLVNDVDAEPLPILEPV